MNQTEQRNARIDKLLADIKSICEALEPGSISGRGLRGEHPRDATVVVGRAESSAGSLPINKEAI